MATNFVPLSFPPGVVKGPSNALAQGRWNDANLVRWINGAARPIGGWEKMALDTPPASTVRAIHRWIDNQGIQRVGVLCEQHAYVIQGDDLMDISPTVPMEGPPSDLTVGGYGDDIYGAGEYGTPRPTKINVRAVGPAWSIDNWGEDLVFMSSYDGRLLRWSPSAPATPASAVPNAPTANRCFIITAERHVVVFAPGEVQNKYQWCDQEDIENWTISTTTTAGFYEIRPNAPIVSAVVIKSGFIFFTTVGPYFSRYIGVPYIYSYDTIAGGSVPFTDGSVVEAGGRAFWYAEDGFWSSDGLSVDPVPCEILDWFKSSITPFFSRFVMSAMNNGSFSEIWWFFPSDGEAFNNRVVIYDYANRWWTMGRVKRTTGYPGSFADPPIMSDGVSFFRHESGDFYNDMIELPYLETGAINSRGGAVMTYVDQFMVDHGGPTTLVDYTIKGFTNRSKQQLAPTITIGPKAAREDGYLDARLTARDIVLRIQSKSNGVAPWTFGQPLVNAVPRGSR